MFWDAGATFYLGFGKRLLSHLGHGRTKSFGGVAGMQCETFA